jgi:PAS domain S-box-containing protein
MGITNEELLSAEVELQKNQIRFEETQELALIGSWEINLKSMEVNWSKEMYKIFELKETVAGLIHKTYQKAIHPDDIPKLDKAIKQLITTGQIGSIEFRILSKDKTIKYISAIGEPLKNKTNGGVHSIRGTVQDITKQKLAALAKSDFLSCMSHEIRTPINGIIGIANLLKEENLSDVQKEYINTLNFSADHLSTLVSDILDFSKIESGQMSFEKISFNLEKNCLQIIKQFEHRAIEKGIKLVFTPEKLGSYSLYGDYGRLNQVLANLLSNALKFTEKGAVTLSYQIIEECEDKINIRFIVKDTGIGIAGCQLDNIFESFTQANESITRKYGGTGLGLTISKKLVELQKGKISVKSKIGEGSAFTVQLSFDKHVYKSSLLPAISIEQLSPIAKDLNGMKILIAEDNNINAMVLTRFLTKWNTKTAVAKDGLEVLHILENEEFDLILMDIQMPNLDGIEATEIIRKNIWKGYANIPIIAFTADASVDTHADLIKKGFYHCITKPFNPDTLYNYLKKSFVLSK